MKPVRVDPGVFWSGLRFVLLSGFSLGASVGLTTLSVEIFLLNPLVAHLVTIVIVWIMNFLLLVFFVFPAKSNGFYRFFMVFFIVTVVLRSLEWAVFALLVNRLEMNYQISILLATPAFALIKFLFLRYFAYRRERNHNPRDTKSRGKSCRIG